MREKRWVVQEGRWAVPGACGQRVPIDAVVSRDESQHLCGKQAGSDLGQLALRGPLSLDCAPGCPELRPASVRYSLGQKSS